VPSRKQLPPSPAPLPLPAHLPGLHPVSPHQQHHSPLYPSQASATSFGRNRWLLQADAAAASPAPSADLAAEEVDSFSEQALSAALQCSDEPMSPAGLQHYLQQQGSSVSLITAATLMLHLRSSQLRHCSVSGSSPLLGPARSSSMGPSCGTAASDSGCAGLAGGCSGPAPAAVSHAAGCSSSQEAE
jgi:hypothetical protein